MIRHPGERRDPASPHRRRAGVSRVHTLPTIRRPAERQDPASSHLRRDRRFTRAHAPHDSSSQRTPRPSTFAPATRPAFHARRRSHDSSSRRTPGSSVSAPATSRRFTRAHALVRQTRGGRPAASCSHGASSALLDGRSRLPNDIDDDVRLRKHRHVAADHLGDGRLHPLRHPALQIGMHGVVLRGEHVP